MQAIGYKIKRTAEEPNGMRSLSRKLLPFRLGCPGNCPVEVGPWWRDQGCIQGRHPSRRWVQRRGGRVPGLPQPLG